MLVRLLFIDALIVPNLHRLAAARTRVENTNARKVRALADQAI